MKHERGGTEPNTDGGSAEGLPHEDLGRVQRADLLDDKVVLELFSQGERTSLIVAPPAGAVLRADRYRRPEDSQVPATQKTLREETVPSRLLSYDEALTPHVDLVRLLQPGSKQRVLVVEKNPRDPRVVLCSAKGEELRVLAVLVGDKRPGDGRDLRKGKLYQPPSKVEPLEASEVSPAQDAFAPPSLPPPSSQVRARARAERKRLRRLIKNLEDDCAKHGDPDVWAKRGEQLKTVLSSVKRGDRTALTHHAEGEPFVVPLDPTLSATGNLERFFKRAKRARAGLLQLQPRLREVTERLVALDHALDLLSDAEREHRESTDRAHVVDVAEARVMLFVTKRGSGGGHTVRRPAAGQSPQRRVPYRKFIGTGDVEILVGRSARDNDDLTFHVAKGHDTWMHCRDATGSHVVVAMALAQLPSDLLIDAAHLAAWFSARREEARVDVQYTARKFVRKPQRGAAPGAVVVSEERVLHLVVDRERCRALLRSEVIAQK